MPNLGSMVDQSLQHRLRLPDSLPPPLPDDHNEIEAESELPPGVKNGIMEDLRRVFEENGSFEIEAHHEEIEAHHNEIEAHHNKIEAEIEAHHNEIEAHRNEIEAPRNEIEVHNEIEASRNETDVGFILEIEAEMERDRRLAAAAFALRKEFARSPEGKTFVQEMKLKTSESATSVEG